MPWDDLLPAGADRCWQVFLRGFDLEPGRPLAADLRRPWERPAPPGRMTPARVRRGFRNIRAKVCPAGAPKPWQAQAARVEEPPPGATL